MPCGLRIVLSGVLGALIAGAGAVWAADPEICTPHPWMYGQVIVE